MTTDTNATIPSSSSSSASDVGLWHSMAFHDADVMTGFLTALGSVEHQTIREHDSARVIHAEWTWPAGGGVMFGSASPDGVLQNAGRSAAYLVCADPDATMAAALAAGATESRAACDNDYGGRGGAVHDPEGNHWSFGTYQPR